MVVKTKPAPTLEQPETVFSRIQSVINADANLQTAREKLTDLENRRATKQAAFDQVQASVSNPDLEGLADRIASGDDLDEHQGLFARRDALQQQLAAFDLAIARQRSVISKATTAASKDVSDALRPEFQRHAAEFLESLRTMRTAFGEMQQFHQAAAGAGVTLTKEFSIVATANIHNVLNAAKHIETEWAAVHG